MQLIIINNVCNKDSAKISCCFMTAEIDGGNSGGLALSKENNR